MSAPSSCCLKTITGCLAASRETLFTTETILLAPLGTEPAAASQAALVLELVPPAQVLFASGGAIGVCQLATSLLPSIMLAPWHRVHLLSPQAPPVWATRPGGTTVSKLTVSWQEPQARRLGLFIQLSALAAGARWHLVQLAASCGYVTSGNCI